LGAPQLAQNPATIGVAPPQRGQLIIVNVALSGVANLSYGRAPEPTAIGQIVVLPDPALRVGGVGSCEGCPAPQMPPQPQLSRKRQGSVKIGP
jgi:hypothetical protein